MKIVVCLAVVQQVSETAKPLAWDLPGALLAVKGVCRWQTRLGQTQLHACVAALPAMMGRRQGKMAER